MATEAEELPVEVTFDATKKKKKKKTGDLQLEADEDAVAAGEGVDAAESQLASLSVDDPSALFGLKKKKKKPRAKEGEEDEDASAAADGEADEGATAAPPADDEDDEGIEETLNLGLKKKKKKKKDKDLDEDAKMDEPAEDDENEDPEAEGDDGDDDAPAKRTGNPWDGSDRDYKYEELLDRVFGILRENNPDLQGEKRRKVLKPPQVLREGTKKTVFANFIELSKTMKRQPEHVMAFLLAELGTSGSLDGQQRLIVKGRFLPKVFEGILRRYVNEYVICNMCKSTDTVLTKEQRLFLLKCNACGASRSVSAIKLGFQAQIGRRKKS